jgi:hypothetical protein
MYDKIANDADWQDGMNAFRASIIKQLDGIYQILEILQKEITKLKQKENTP